MWVQLRTVKHIESHGKLVKREPGDWVKVGKQQAMQWIAELSAWIPPQRITELTAEGCGIRIMGKKPPDFVLSESRLGLKDGAGIDLPYPQTLLWHPSLRLRGEMVPVGFHLLNTWQIAAPLWDYQELACHIADEGDKERTADMIGDLRVPMYDTRLIFVKRCGDTEALIDCWKEEGEGKLAFLRALYQVKPLILALPITWKGKMV